MVAHVTADAPDAVMNILDWTFEHAAQHVALALQGATPEEKARGDAYFCDRAVVTPLNKTADAINQAMLETLSADNMIVSLSTDKAKEFQRFGLMATEQCFMVTI